MLQVHLTSVLFGVKYILGLEFNTALWECKDLGCLWPFCQPHNLLTSSAWTLTLWKNVCSTSAGTLWLCPGRARVMAERADFGNSGKQRRAERFCLVLKLWFLLLHRKYYQWPTNPTKGGHWFCSSRAQRAKLSPLLWWEPKAHNATQDKAAFLTRKHSVSPSALPFILAFILFSTCLHQELHRNIPGCPALQREAFRWEMENFSVFIWTQRCCWSSLLSHIHPSSCHGLGWAASFCRGMAFIAGLGLEGPSGCSPRTWGRIKKDFWEVAVTIYFPQVFCCWLFPPCSLKQWLHLYLFLGTDVLRRWGCPDCIFNSHTRLYPNTTGMTKAREHSWASFCAMTAAWAREHQKPEHGACCLLHLSCLLCRACHLRHEWCDWRDKSVK